MGEQKVAEGLRAEIEAIRAVWSHGTRKRSRLKRRVRRIGAEKDRIAMTLLAALHPESQGRVCGRGSYRIWLIG